MTILCSKYTLSTKSKKPLDTEESSKQIPDIIRQWFIQKCNGGMHLQPALHIDVPEAPLQGQGLIHIKTGHLQVGEHVDEFSGHAQQGTRILMSQKDGEIKTILNEKHR